VKYWSLDTEDSVAVLTFTPPPSNLLSLAAMTELADALDDLAIPRGEVTVVVLTGGVDGFLADADRDELALLAAGEPVEGDPGAWFRALSTLESMPQPTVAAMDGQVGGGGFATALACTLRIGSERTSLGPLEVDLGIVGSDSARRLVRVLGPAVSAELLLTGRMVQADEARRIGLLNDAVPAEGFRDHVREWCGRITGHPPATVFAAKRAVVDGLSVVRDEVLTIANSFRWLS
jgi:enoyl-CoA hydratase/carnithine racemase